MFSEKEIKEYKSIQAPEKLREDICSISVEKNHKSRKWVYSMATAVACLLCVVTGALVLGSRSSLEVYVQGERIVLNEAVDITEDSPQETVAMARAMPVGFSIPFEMKEDVTFTEPQEGVLVQEDETHYCWTLFEMNPECEYQLFFQEKSKEYIMTVEYDEEKDGWEVRLEKGKN